MWSPRASEHHLSKKGRERNVRGGVVAGEYPSLHQPQTNKKYKAHLAVSLVSGEDAYSVIGLGTVKNSWERNLAMIETEMLLRKGGLRES